MTRRGELIARHFAIEGLGATAPAADPTLVLGLGNDILSDDGVGLLAARRVAELVGDLANVAEACVATIDLLALISGYDRVVIIDSFLSPDLPPGTPVRVTPDDLPEGFGYRSFHTLTFREMLDIGNWLGPPVPQPHHHSWPGRE